MKKGSKKNLVNKKNPKNIYCAHCEHWEGGDVRLCTKTDEHKEYYQRCKAFEWRQNIVDISNDTRAKE